MENKLPNTTMEKEISVRFTNKNIIDKLNKFIYKHMVYI